MGTLTEDARNFTTEVVKLMHQVHGMDYSDPREFIQTWVEENMWRGDWDLTIDFDGTNFEKSHRALRFIQEDEYDQHMDEDEDRPPNDIGYVDGYYVFFAD